VPQDVQKIQANIVRMVQQGANEAEIDSYLNMEGVTPYDLGAERETSQSLGFEKGFKEPLLNLQSATESVPGVGQGAPWLKSGQYKPSTVGREELQTKIDTASSEGIKPGLTGEIGGNIVGTIPTMMLKGGQAIQGGVEGALLSDADTLSGRAGDAAIGSVTGVVGKGVFDAAGKVISPNIKNAASNLYEKGIEHLTPGQTMGGWAKGIEDALTSIPWIGDAIQEARSRGVEDFNRVIISDILSPIKQTIPENLPKFGREAVKYVGDQLSAGYDRLLPKLIAVGDAELAQSMNRIMSEYTSTMSAENAKTLANIVKNKIPKALYSEGGISGKQYNNLMSSFKRLSAQKKSSGQGEVADAIDEFASSFEDLLQRSNPEFAGELTNLRTGWSKLADVEIAAGGAGADSGLFTPAQYLSAIKRGDKSVRKRAFARGENQMQEFAEQAKEVLPSKLADSGTAKRGAALALFGGLGAGAINPITGAAVLGGSGLYTKFGQKAINKGLFGRGKVAETYAQWARRMGVPSSKISTAAVAQQNRNK
tara:strand:- start:2081 stop:3694 length:1614 start_codon:yes stop_codon:yes gene_type:complete